jgi:hypothetical protein
VKNGDLLIMGSICFVGWEGVKSTESETSNHAVGNLDVVSEWRMSCLKD